ncbi:MAG: hypothetical protein GWN58_37350, partial [Anaerolineae bacterium]|nr:hypothetical protein [Anaerolineae bacterium]
MASQYLNALGRGGMAEDQLGATRYIDRKVGRVQALQFIDDGVIMLDQEALGVLKSEQVSKG